jgi:hypothetical protein
MDTREQDRINQINQLIPEIWDHNKILYIGAHPKRFHFKTEMLMKNCLIDVLEYGKENCKFINSIGDINRVIQGDVTNILNYFDDSEGYDTILWSHGPNMIKRSKLDWTLIQLEKLAYNIVLLTPFGYKYEYPGNTSNMPDYMNACSHYIPEDFEKLGYKTDTIGIENQWGNNLLAWKLL